MKSFIIIFILAALGASSAVTFDSACLDVDVVSSFNVSAYLGTWYEYARYYTAFEDGSACNTAQYTANDDGTVAVINSQTYTGTGIVASITGTATLDDADSGVAKLTVTFPVSTAPYWVLGTDYNSYSIAWTCVESTDDSGVVSSDRSVFIITREQVPSSDVITAATAVLTNNNIDTSILVFADQSSC